MANIHEIAEKLKSEGRRKKSHTAPCLLANFNMDDIRGVPAGSIVPPMVKPMAFVATANGDDEPQIAHGAPSSLGSNKVADRVAAAPSSSSLIELDQNLKTTTSDPELPIDAKVHLSPEWAVVDTSPLSEIGFTPNHFNQLVKAGKFSADEVQDFIYFFAFDLKSNGKGRKIKGPPVNFFMGILQKGMPYAAPENYESPEAEARMISALRSKKESRKPRRSATKWRSPPSKNGQADYSVGGKGNKWGEIRVKNMRNSVESILKQLTSPSKKLRARSRRYER